MRDKLPCGVTANLSEKTVYAILNGEPVRAQTLSIFRQIADRIATEPQGRSTSRA